MGKSRKKKQRDKLNRTRKVGKSVKEINNTIKQLVKKITGKPFRGTIGIVSKFVLNKYGRLISGDSKSISLSSGSFSTRTMLLSMV